MSIIFEETGTETVAYAIDENGFNWLRVPCPYDGAHECWGCENLLAAKKLTDEDEDRVSVGTHCWYSVSEAVVYCDNCVTLPTTGS